MESMRDEMRVKMSNEMRDLRDEMSYEIRDEQGDKG